VVLSVFMLGLAIGSWVGGRLIPVWTARTGGSAIFFYAGAELLIGTGALQVPRMFALGKHLLLTSGEENSFQYLSLSAVVLAASILPWCICMGATFPLMMAYVREQTGPSPQSFSFLYLANVLGAMSGTLLTAFVLVEMFGFHLTLQMAAMGNCLIAVIAGWQGWRQQRPSGQPREKPAPPTPLELPLPNQARNRQIRGILFATGFCAMAMEVVWTRAFTPVLKTEVYSFASIVFTYLGATFIGSWGYRRDLKKKAPKTTASLMAFLVVVVLLPIVATDPRFVKMSWVFDIHAVDLFIVLASICPFCALLGYLTPALIDEYAAGEPTIAGRAYAINVLGCILGPLVASYLLLPCLSEHWAMVALSLPFFGFYLAGRKLLPKWQRSASGLAVGAIAVLALLICHDFQDQVAEQAGHVEVHRDYAASVVSAGSGMNRILLVNGIGMTALTPITKFMVHLPMAYHAGKPESVLIICFGMGTCYRSALTWGVPTTAVELIPDVPRAFSFYHADASTVLNNPNGRIVIDDGRRFLERTQEKYDVIVVDPPPPIQAAGCSLLFSTEFYDLVKQHLKPGGILQAWIPAGGDQTIAQGFLAH
jgi:spermidine synthase